MRYLKQIWGLIWLVAWLPLGAQSIVQLEYFFDQDPGVGNGTPLTVTAGDTATTTVNVPLTGLTQGFHQLMVRALDVDGTWSLYAKRSFFVQGGAQSGPPPLSSTAEYFFDQDPGIGNGTPMPWASGDTSIYTGYIPLAGLADGFHSMHVRIMDIDGTWSLYSKRTFYLQDTTQRRVAPLVAWEHYFDQDPGAGNGVVSYFPDPVDTAVIHTGLPVVNLAAGTHTTYVRFLDADGNWSLPVPQEFEITDCLVDQPSINVGTNNQLSASLTGERYLWYLDGNLLVGDTANQTIQATQNGVYQVRVVIGGCISPRSEVLIYTVTSLDPLAAVGNRLSLFPNPAGEQVHLQLESGPSVTGKILLRDVQGRILRTSAEQTLTAGSRHSVSLDGLASGLYILQMHTMEGILSRRFLKR